MRKIFALLLAVGVLWACAGLAGAASLAPADAVASGCAAGVNIACGWKAIVGPFQEDRPIVEKRVLSGRVVPTMGEDSDEIVTYIEDYQEDDSAEGRRVFSGRTFSVLEEDSDGIVAYVEAYRP